MSEESHDRLRSGALEQMAARYEALVRDLGILRLVEDMAPLGLSAGELGARIAGAIARDDGPEQCSIMRFDAHRGRLVLLAVGSRYAERGFPVPEGGWRGKEFALGEGVAGQVAATRSHLHIMDVQRDGRFLALPESTVVVRSLLCFPLVADDTLLGVMNLSHSQPGFFSPDREHSTWLLARRASELLLAAWNREAPGTPPHGADADAPDATPEYPVHLRAEYLHAVGEIAGGVGRELGGLLGQVVHTIEGAEKTGTLDEARAAIAVARRTAVRGAAIANHLMAFASALRSPRTTARIDLPEIFREVKSLLDHESHGHGLFTVDMPAAFPPLEGDRNRLHQTFVNLGMNALEALASKEISGATNGRWVHLGAEIVRRSHLGRGPWGESGNGLFVRAFVADNGVGMEPDVARKACNPCFSTKGGHAGLGLTTAFQVARAHGGWLSLESAPGYGTTVSLYLPVPVESEAAPPSADIGEARAAGRPVVLLVDDEPLVRKVGAAILGKLGYYVVSAENGQEALGAWEKSEGAIDLAVIDVNMPDMDGRAVLARLREGNPSLPVVLSSGDHMEEGPDEPAHLRATAYLEKPYLISTMAEVIRDALGRARD